jgi:hypothetical protein
MSPIELKRYQVEKSRKVSTILENSINNLTNQSLEEKVDQFDEGNNNITQQDNLSQTPPMSPRLSKEMESNEVIDIPQFEEFRLTPQKKQTNFEIEKTPPAPSSSSKSEISKIEHNSSILLNELNSILEQSE